MSDETHFPADKEIELALLGKILLDQAMDGLDHVKPEDFYFGRNGEIFSRMRRIWDGGIVALDPVLIADRDNELHSIMAEAMAIPEPLTPAAAYADRLRNLAKKRRMIPLLEEVARRSLNGVPYDEISQYLLDEMENPERRPDHDTWQVRQASGLAEPPAPREWLLDGLLYRGQISMWYGPPGIKKTLFLMDMCAALATGKNWLMRRSWQKDHATVTTFHATRPARILWLDYDNGEFETEVRVRAALTAREGLSGAPFFYMSETIPWLSLSDASHVRRVIRLALDVGADVIVFDALGMILGDVDENSPDVARVIAKLKEIRSATGAAIACVHHPSKSGAQNDKMSTYNAAGSAKFSNFFEWSIELREGDENGTIVANVVKHRGWAKITKFAAELEYTHFGKDRPELAHELETFKFYPYALESAGEKRTDAVREAVLAILATGAKNQKELIAAVKVDAESALGHPIGTQKIRDEILKLAADDEIKASQAAPNQAVLYSLATSA